MHLLTITSKLSLTELTCLQSHYVYFVCIYLVVEFKCLAKVLPCIVISAQEALCFVLSIQHLDHVIHCLSDGKPRLYAL